MSPEPTADPANQPAPSGSAPLPRDPDQLVDLVRSGDRRALARCISMVENGDPAARTIVSALYGETGKASLLGITGAPGVGKSSLVSSLIRHLRAEHSDRKLGVISVDPSSPFTEGALLGDRIRLTEHFLDRDVFIRSMGTRGHLGGLSEATLQAALLMDAFGMHELFLETVGVGQSEIEIARIADTIVLVLMPGSGDSVQALKAGIMEIPDIIVINKADHPAARTLHQQVRSILTLNHDRAWMPKIVETEAINNVGIDKLWAAVLEHREHLSQGDNLQQRRRANLDAEVFSLASTRAMQHLHRRVADDPRLRELLDAMHRRELDPLSCTMQLFEEVFER